MANPFDALNQGLERLSTSPLGMAGLGLLMQPSQSLTPINPMEYAARGMQMGIQNRRTQQEDKRRAEEYKLAIEEYNRKKLKYEEEKARKEQEQRALDAAMANLPPEQIPMARVLGKDFLKMQLENSMKSPQLTTLQQNLIAAGLQPGTAPFQEAIMKGIMTPRVQIGTPEKPFSPSDLARIEGPGGKAPRIGMTPSEAANQGYTVRQAPPPMTPEQQISFEQQKAEAQISQKQAFANQQAAAAIQRVNNAIQRLGPTAALTPTARAEYASMIDAAANAIAKARGTPGAEPPAQAIDRARESLPRIEELIAGPIIGDTTGAKIGALLEEFGVSNRGMTAPKKGAPVRNETDFQERLRKYVPGAR